MKKKIIMRSLGGAPIGVLISVIVAVCISYSIGDGNFHYVSYDLTQDCGSEINAAFWQLLVTILYGAAFGGLSVIWECDDWSIFKQSVSYYVISVLLTVAVTFELHWVEYNFFAVLIYLTIFTVIYLLVFVFKFLFMKSIVKKFNSKVNEKSE